MGTFYNLDVNRFFNLFFLWNSPSRKNSWLNLKEKILFDYKIIYIFIFICISFIAFFSFSVFLFEKKKKRERGERKGKN